MPNTANAERTSAITSARRENSNAQSLRVPALADAMACGCRTERLNPGGVQVHAGSHQAERQGKPETGQHRDDPERAIACDERNGFHYTPLVDPQTGFEGAILRTKNFMPNCQASLIKW